MLYLTDTGNKLRKVKWLRLLASAEEGTGSIPGQGTKILHVKQHDQRKKLF